jgi:L-methionine (R)-S-oxide reductase
MTDMLMERDKLMMDLHSLVSMAKDRAATLQGVAELLRSSGSYRWVGLYDVDYSAGVVRNIVWSGPGAPEYPRFSITKGLTAAAISSRKTVNVGDVVADPRYLTAFGTTRSEIIVPVFDGTGESVIGTIDVESEKPNAFPEDVQAILETSSKIIQPLWRR